MNALEMFVEKSCKWDLETCCDIILHVSSLCANEFLKPNLSDLDSKLALTTERIERLAKQELEVHNQILKLLQQSEETFKKSIQNAVEQKKDIWIASAGEAALEGIDMNNAVVNRREVIDKCAGQIARLISSNLEGEIHKAVVPHITNLSKLIQQSLHALAKDVELQDLSLKATIATYYYSGSGNVIKTIAKGGAIASGALVAVGLLGVEASAQIIPLLLGTAIIGGGATLIATASAGMVLALGALFDQLRTVLKGVAIDKEWKKHIAKSCLTSFDAGNCAREVICDL